jgi:hypothetical protein
MVLPGTAGELVARDSLILLRNNKEQAHSKVRT